MKFNLNSYVKVRLTSFGKETLRSNFEEQKRNLPSLYSNEEFVPPHENSQGWSEWQLWKLMNTFGEYMYMGSREIPFELDIEILENS